MSNLRMVEAKLPPGFRFHPRDEELIYDYLLNKVAGTAVTYHPVLIEVDLNSCEPWDIPETACVGGKDWYFYSQRDRKYATGLRTNRATVSGYWKATGKDRPIHRKGKQLLGMRKTLVFYQGRAPKGKKTDWVMHEFRLHVPITAASASASASKEDWVLCKVFNKTKGLESAAKEEKEEDEEEEEMGKKTYYSGLDDNTSITSCSSDLPPLTEYYNSYNSYSYQQQVPCFSNNNHNPSDHHGFIHAAMMIQKNTASIFNHQTPLISSSSSSYGGKLEEDVFNNNIRFPIRESSNLETLLSDHHVHFQPAIWD